MEVPMKKASMALLVAAALTLPGIASARTVLRCTNAKRLGAPSYAVTAGQSSMSLWKVPMNPTAKPILIATVPAGAAVIYGNAWILTANHGRSGYAHLYASPQRSLIDINLFAPGRGSTVNTNGPVTDYTCRK
jgi:hypothetical protein